MQILEDYIIAEREADAEPRRHGANAMSRLLALKTRPDGVFCFNDPLAMGAMNLIWDRGLRVPYDIAMIGCGNLHYPIYYGCRSQLSISTADESGRKHPVLRSEFSPRRYVPR
jgi:DNA-binding LacI/PurR family transcriptional regulator